MYFQGRRAKKTCVSVSLLKNIRTGFFFEKESVGIFFKRDTMCMYFKRDLYVCMSKKTYVYVF